MTGMRRQMRGKSVVSLQAAAALDGQMRWNGRRAQALAAHATVPRYPQEDDVCGNGHRGAFELGTLARRCNTLGRDNLACSLLYLACRARMPGSAVLRLAPRRLFVVRTLPRLLSLQNSELHGGCVSTRPEFHTALELECTARHGILALPACRIPVPRSLGAMPRTNINAGGAVYYCLSTLCASIERSFVA